MIQVQIKRKPQATSSWATVIRYLKPILASGIILVLLDLLVAILIAIILANREAYCHWASPRFQEWFSIELGVVIPIGILLTIYNFVYALCDTRCTRTAAVRDQDDRDNWELAPEFRDNWVLHSHHPYQDGPWQAQTVSQLLAVRSGLPPSQQAPTSNLQQASTPSQQAPILSRKRASTSSLQQASTPSLQQAFTPSQQAPTSDQTFGEHSSQHSSQLPRTPCPTRRRSISQGYRTPPQSVRRSVSVDDTPTASPGASVSAGSPGAPVHLRRDLKVLLSQKAKLWSYAPADARLKELMRFEDDHDESWIPSCQDVEGEQRRYERYARDFVVRDTQPIHVYGTPALYELDRLRLWVKINQHQDGPTWPPNYVPTSTESDSVDDMSSLFSGA